MGVRKVTVSCIGPACTVQIVRVGVICVVVRLVAFMLRGAPSHRYVVPSTLIIPAQPLLWFYTRLNTTCISRLEIDTYVDHRPEPRPGISDGCTVSSA